MAIQTFQNAIPALQKLKDSMSPIQSSDMRKASLRNVCLSIPNAYLSCTLQKKRIGTSSGYTNVFQNAIPALQKVKNSMSPTQYPDMRKASLRNFVYQVQTLIFLHFAKEMLTMHWKCKHFQNVISALQKVNDSIAPTQYPDMRKA